LGQPINIDAVQFLPPFPNPGKIICIGLNYVDHSAEVGIALPAYPTVFARFASSLIGHGAPIPMPRQSTQLDYEGELVAVIGRGGQNISREKALDHVAGYSIFNDITVRDYQLRTSQWTLGKNFDGTGAFGPFFVVSEDLPAGCKGLRLTTRLNGRIVQDAAITDMVFDVEALIESMSDAFTLSAGDIIVTGTPGGIGMGRHPPLWMKPGDVCEVEIPGLGILRNSVVIPPARD
jgi:2-keto-4-pentenoate hydratase/2-oxohepta-3-ene-1,7-dioic acid hydratase in catechol pathway